MPEKKDQRPPSPNPGYRFVPLNSPEGRALAAGQQTGELTPKDREDLKKMRESLDNINAAMPYYLDAEDALSRIDEGPISGRIGGLFANVGIGANVPDYEMVKSAVGKIATIGLRDIGGSDTEKEFERLTRQSFDINKTPEYNARIFARAKRLQRLAEAEVVLAEQWINSFGSLVARNPKGMTFEKARKQLRDKAQRELIADRQSSRGGWSIVEVRN
jgi:hypothetical protein